MPARPRVDILNINFFDWDGVRAFNGGAERYVLDLARMLSVLGMRPRLLQNARIAFERQVEGFEVVGIPAAPRFDLGAMSEGFAAATCDAELVIASPLELASRLGSGPPVVGINHGIWWDFPAYRTTHPELSDREALFAALHAVAACVAVDTNFINWLRAEGEAVDRVVYVPNYVDHSQFRAVAKDFDAARLAVLFPRRLCAERGFHETMRAFEMLWAQGVPCDLHLCGGGVAAEEELARAFVTKHPGRARWSEAEPADMPDVYAASHVVLIPTLFSEGTSLACLEAMATNNGVVATHVGGLPNLILDEVNGLLVKPGADALAAAVRRLVSNRRLLATMAARAQEVAATFTARKWQERWGAVLGNVRPELRPEIDRWLDALPCNPLPAVKQPSDVERDLASARSALTDAQARLWTALGERDGASRAALVATFDRDAARRHERRARGECEEAKAKERDARAGMEAMERELAQARARLHTLAASRGVRWLRALDPAGRFLLPPVDRRMDGSHDDTAATAVADGVVTVHRGMRPECCGLVAGLVSVVLPVYNQADLVGDAIRSVLTQTYPHLELIVIDDGSTDGIAAVLDSFAADPRMRVVAQANAGLPQALSNGFALARGEYWTWTSADNLMAARQLELMVARLGNAPEVGMVYADFWAIDDQGNPLADPGWRAHDRPDPRSNRIRLPRTTERLNVVPDNFIGPCFLYRGWIGRILGPYHGQQGVEDYDYWMRMNSLFTIEHLGIDDPLYWYRVHANSLSGRSEEERIPRKIERLMATEQGRAQWNRLPLVVHLDRELGGAQMLRSMDADVREFDSLEELRLPQGGPSVVVTGIQRVKSVAHAEALGVVVPLVVAIPPGAPLAEDAPSVLRRPHVLVVVETAQDAGRVAAVSSVPIVDANSSLLGVAIGAFARHASYGARSAR
jgi:glycosyltransferase involved in cell wall biosynthesis